MKSRAGAAFVFVLLAACATPQRELPAYRLIEDPAESAQPVARRIVDYLAAGELEQASALSNAPERRLQVLRDYRATVGETEFRRVFAAYAARPLVAEIAIGERRLLIWDLEDAAHNLGGQYFVRAGSGFVMDDVPSAERSSLQRVLGAYRARRIKPAGETG